MREAVNVDKFGHVITVVCEHPKRAACVDRLELRIVSDEQHFRPTISSKLSDSVEGERSSE